MSQGVSEDMANTGFLFWWILMDGVSRMVLTTCSCLHLYLFIGVDHVLCNASFYISIYHVCLFIYIYL